MTQTVIRNGLVFDGSGDDGRLVDVRIVDGVVVELATELHAPDDATVIEAEGCWVMPGIRRPAHPLRRRARDRPRPHRVAPPRRHHRADRFVRAVVRGGRGRGPRRHVLPGRGRAARRGAAAARAHQGLEGPRGVPGPPRAGAAGPQRVLVPRPLGAAGARHGPGPVARRPGRAHRRASWRRWPTMLEAALDAGYLGLSINTLPWDKMDGDRYRSRPTPSVFSKWREYRSLAEVLRRRDAVLEGVPDISGRWNIALFLGVASGLRRKPLRTTIISMMDVKAAPGTHKVIGAVTDRARRLLNAGRAVAVAAPAVPALDRRPREPHPRGDRRGDRGVAPGRRCPGRPARRPGLPGAVREAVVEPAEGSCVPPRPRRGDDRRLSRRVAGRLLVRATWPRRAARSASRRSSTCRPSTATICAGPPRSATPTRTRSPGSSTTPRRRSASPTRARTCATWRSTTSRSTCCGWCATDRSGVSPSCPSAGRCTG